MNHKVTTMIIDPTVQKFLDKLAAQGGTPLYKLSVDDARKVLDDLQADAVIEISADSEDRTIPGGPRGSVDISIIRPRANTHKLPVIIFMHGAGWVLGNKGTHDRLVREIVNGCQAAVVFVNYLRAPEAQYPSIHEEGYAAAKWIAENGTLFNLDTSRMVIAGDSVGGLEATAIAMMAQERGGPQFIFQLLLYPVTDANFDTSSYKEFEQGPWLTKAAMEWFWDNYVPDKTLRAQPFVAPLQASLEQLKNLPPTLIIVNEFDVLRDEGEAYAHKLMQAGVSVVAVRYLGLIHDSAMLNAITQAPSVREMIAQINQVLSDVFEKNR